ncbi:MAG: hypothetical protein ACFCUI_06965 [Bernardetiaceae bacterium]
MDPEHLWAYLIVYLTSSVKFIFGPVGGFLAGLNGWEMFFLTVLGMMSSVVVLTFFGLWLRVRWQRFLGRRSRRFTPRNRKLVLTWRKYGLIGVAFLTPVLFSPVVGTMIAVSFGERKERIIFHMAWSAVFWAGVFSLSLHIWGQSVLDILNLSTE